MASNIDLILSDCMPGMHNTPDKFYDLAIVDPPYRDAKDNAPTKDMREKSGNMFNWNNKPKEYYFQELMRVSKNQIIWGGNNFIDHLYSTNCFIFWYKQNPMDNYSDGELAWTSFNSVAKCVNIPYFGTLNADKYGKIHPTQKPEKLYRWLLKNYAKPGDKILDTHLGSGSIAIACYDMGYDLTGYEIDQDYYNAAVKRLENHKKQLTFI